MTLSLVSPEKICDIFAKSAVTTHSAPQPLNRPRAGATQYLVFLTAPNPPYPLTGFLRVLTWRCRRPVDNPT